jgi:hypothetical protein
VHSANVQDIIANEADDVTTCIAMRSQEALQGLTISGSENDGQYRSCLRLAASFGNQNASNVKGAKSGNPTNLFFSDLKLHVQEPNYTPSSLF